MYEQYRFWIACFRDHVAYTERYWYELTPLSHRLFESHDHDWQLQAVQFVHSLAQYSITAQSRHRKDDL